MDFGTLLAAIALWLGILFFKGFFKAMLKTIRGGKK